MNNFNEKNLKSSVGQNINLLKIFKANFKALLIFPIVFASLGWGYAESVAKKYYGSLLIYPIQYLANSNGAFSQSLNYYDPEMMVADLRSSFDSNKELLKSCTVSEGNKIADNYFPMISWDVKKNQSSTYIEASIVAEDINIISSCMRAIYENLFAMQTSRRAHIIGAIEHLIDINNKKIDEYSSKLMGSSSQNNQILMMRIISFQDQNWDLEKHKLLYNMPIEKRSPKILIKSIPRGGKFFLVGFFLGLFITFLVVARKEVYEYISLVFDNQLPK